MKNQMTIEMKRAILEILEKNETIVKKVVRSIPLITNWINPTTNASTMSAQINLDGLASFRLPYVTPAQKELVNKMVPGRVLLLSVGKITTAKGTQSGASTLSGNEVKAPAEFVNYNDVDILFISKGESLDVDTDDDLGDDLDFGDLTVVDRESRAFGAPIAKKTADEEVLVGESEI